ncbi:hypothetical protein DE4585_02651 [Mycobacteroides salmoniphilum]|uniref:Uncharacterized protein n=1 Tax=Mycobacteroides salmoniphilum TaxID=404941 RepID=A0A4V3HY79_9MYCO|nr:hypothetical protein DE4585_02651 [Mycobacteroides salmoniphilum]
MAGICALALIFGAVAIKWHSHIRTEHDRTLQKQPAIALCQNAIRKAVHQHLSYTDISAPEQAAITASARFTGAEGNYEPLSFDNFGVPTSLGRSRSSVLTNWQISGHLSLDGKLPFASGLGSENRFMCSAIVFDDDTIYVASTQIIQ